MKDMEFRRFKLLTDDEKQKERFLSLCEDKNLSREDLILILTSICISPQLYRDYVLKRI